MFKFIAAAVLTVAITVGAVSGMVGTGSDQADAGGSKGRVQVAIILC